jgi:hypothetical protein
MIAKRRVCPLRHIVSIQVGGRVGRNGHAGGFVRKAGQVLREFDVPFVLNLIHDVDAAMKVPRSRDSDSPPPLLFSDGHARADNLLL